VVAAGKDRVRPTIGIVRRICGWFTEGFDTFDLKQAKALLDELHA